MVQHLTLENHHKHLLEWLDLEWAYQRTKFPDPATEPAADIDPTVGLGHATNYWHQGINVFGLDTLQGRQRAAKALATEVAVLVFAMQRHGDLPQPGMSSSDGAVEWQQ